MSEPDGTSRDRSHLLYVALTGALVFLVLWVRPMTSSLWLDELGTWWTVKDGLGEALSRALEYQGQSPGYYLVAWITKEIAGPNEWALRLPSLLASLASVVLFYRLVRRLVDREAAMFAALGFVGLDGVAFAASEFRPYALALFLLIASMLVLVRWMDGGGWLDEVLYVCTAALVVWGHYLFALALIAQVIYVVVKLRSGTTSVRWRSVIGAWAAVLLLVAPLAGQLVSLWGRRTALSIPNDVGVEQYVTSVFRPVFIGALVFGGLIAWSLGRLALRTTKGREGAAVLLWSWLLVPISTMFLVSAFTPLDFYSPRYYVSGAPAGAALFGWAVSCIHPAQARRVIGVAFAILAVMTARGSLKVGQDWRGLAEAERVFANDHTLVLMHPVFIEARQLDWLDDPERRSYLLAPTSFYPMEGDMVAMPYAADESGLAYLARLEAEIDDRDRILLVTQSENRAPFRTWLDARLGPDGWTSRSVGRFGLIELFEFTRGEGAPPTG